MDVRGSARHPSVALILDRPLFPFSWEQEWRPDDGAFGGCRLVDGFPRHPKMGEAGSIPVRRGDHGWCVMSERSLPGIGEWTAETPWDERGNSPQRTTEGHHARSSQPAHCLCCHPYLDPFSRASIWLTKDPAVNASAATNGRTATSSRRTWSAPGGRPPNLRRAVGLDASLER